MGTPIGRKAWLSAALICLAMLIVPALGWVLFPKPGAPLRAPPTAASLSGTSAEAAPSGPSSTRPEIGRVEPTRDPARERRTDPEGAPRGPITGLVVDPEGAPIARAVVRCDDPELSLTASTDDEGRFELPAEAAGCNAAARHPSFSPSEGTRLTAGGRNTLRLSRGGSIAGTVVDERGTAVTSYLLAIESFFPSMEDGPSPPTGRPRTITDPAGQFLLDNLPSGRYVLTASAEGRPPTRSSSIDVKAGRTTSRVRIDLARGARLAGIVTDAESRRPIGGARVGLDAATSSGANAIGGAATSADGSYLLEGVPPGPFSVRVSAEGYRTKIVAGLTTRGSASIRENIALQPHGDGNAGESELVGIGAVLAPSPKGVIVASLIEGGPASRAGLQPGDRIARIDGADASSMSVSDCVQRLRGPEGSRVSIALAREGANDVEVTVVRATIVR